MRLSDEDDPSILISAALFYSTLEDGRNETEQLMDEKSGNNNYKIAEGFMRMGTVAVVRLSASNFCYPLILSNIAKQCESPFDKLRVRTW